jgi:hypothetical protein
MESRTWNKGPFVSSGMEPSGPQLPPRPTKRSAPAAAGGGASEAAPAPEGAAGAAGGDIDLRALARERSAARAATAAPQDLD